MVSSSPIPKFLQTTALAIVLALVTFAVFSNTFQVPFLLDDASSIENNRSIRQLWPMAEPSIGGTRGRPVANVSLALNYQMSGLDPESYHWTNLGIHVAAGLCLLGVIRRTLRLPLLEGRFSQPAVAEAVAFGGALLWLVHPLQTEAVTYVVQRTESLMGLFYLSTLYGFVRAVQSSTGRIMWQVFAVIACFAGMACKEVMITVPVAVFLYDRTFVAGTFRNAWRERRGFHLALASSWIALAWLMSGHGDRGVGFAHNVGPWQYALTESCVLLRYFKLSLWPVPLVFDYGSTMAHSLREVWPCGLLILSVLTAVVATLRFRPVAGFLLAWPFLTLAPTSSFVPVALQPMAEHRMYLPLAGILTLIVLLVGRYLGTKAWMLIIVLGCVLGTTAYRRNAVYASEVLLWKDTVDKSPRNDRARVNLALAYLKANRLTEAETELEHALSLNSRNVEALSNVGVLYARTGRQLQAIERFEEILLRSPGFAEAHYNRECVLMELGRKQEAQASFVQAITLNPDYGNAHINLAAILGGEGKFREALDHYAAALRVHPEDPQLYMQRAYANVRLGRVREAIADYESALSLRPNLVEARHNLDLLRRESPAPAR